MRVARSDLTSRDLGARREVLVTLTLQPSKPSVGRPTPMRIGLSPYGTAAHKRWLVNYWLPATNDAKVGYTGPSG